MKRIAIAVLGLALLGTGCKSYNDARGRGDAPIGEYDDSPAYILNFPDKFMNIAFKCLGPNGVYTHTRQGPPVVIVDDGNCK